jgi:hypothetical protein
MEDDDIQPYRTKKQARWSVVVVVSLSDVAVTLGPPPIERPPLVIVPPSVTIAYKTIRAHAPPAS